MLNEKMKLIKSCLRELKLTECINSIEDYIQKAQESNISYIDYTLSVLQSEIKKREEKRVIKNLKFANLPRNNDLQNYDFKCENGLNKTQLNQLRELSWLDKNYNLIILGPPGIGKTYIASGLGLDAVRAGYNVIFKTMDELNRILKLKDITKSMEREYTKILKSNLFIIDDMLMFPVEKNEAIKLFHLINIIHEKNSLIITTNKEPREWAQMLNDEIIATAILDRIMFRCQPICMKGNSYRLNNRKTIFDNPKKKQNNYRTII